MPRGRRLIHVASKHRCVSDALSQSSVDPGRARQSKSTRVARASGRYASEPTSKSEERSTSKTDSDGRLEQPATVLWRTLYNSVRSTSAAPKARGANMDAAYLRPKFESVHSDAKTLTSRAETENQSSARCAVGVHLNGATARIDTIWSASTTIEIDAGTARCLRRTVMPVSPALLLWWNATKMTCANEAPAAPKRITTNATSAPSDARGHLVHSPRPFAKYPCWQSLQR
eukprot:Amastigsp_a177069_19.p2 type:complete len:230 gc:universal Amastigsp_a177069_19:929-240(-)